MKFSYGQYWFGPGDGIGFNANPNSSQWWRRYAWSDLDGSGVWEPGEEGRPLDRRGGVALESLDPELDLPFVREVGGWIERELHANVGMRTGIVWRGERQHFLRQNANRPFEAFSVPVAIRDPGPDGQVATADDGPAIPGYELGPELVRASRTTSCATCRTPTATTGRGTSRRTGDSAAGGRWSLDSRTPGAGIRPAGTPDSPFARTPIR